MRLAQRFRVNHPSAKAPPPPLPMSPEMLRCRLDVQPPFGGCPRALRVATVGGVWQHSLETTGRVTQGCQLCWLCPRQWGSRRRGCWLVAPRPVREGDAQSRICQLAVSWGRKLLFSGDCTTSLR